MNVAALDLGSVTGLAFGQAGGTPTARSIELVGDRISRGVELRDILREFFEDARPDILYVEAPPNLAGMIQKGTNIASLQALYGYEMVAGLVARDFAVRAKPVDVQVARRHFLGLGKIPKGKGKELVMQRCRMLRWGFENNNEADALCLWDYACAIEKPNAWMKAVQSQGARGRSVGKVR